MTVKRKDIVKKKLKAVSISIIYFSVTNYLIIERRDLATLVTWLLLLVIFWNFKYLSFFSSWFLFWNSELSSLSSISSSVFIDPSKQCMVSAISSGNSTTSTSILWRHLWLSWAQSILQGLTQAQSNQTLRTTIVCVLKKVLSSLLRLGFRTVLPTIQAISWKIAFMIDKVAFRSKDLVKSNQIVMVVPLSDMIT